MTMSNDDALDTLVRALLERRFFSLGRIQQKTGVSKTEVPGYLDRMVAVGKLSQEDRATALQNMSDWKRWGRRNAMFVIPIGLTFIAYEGVQRFHHGGATAVAVPLAVAIVTSVAVQLRYRQRRASRLSRSRD